jgi:uncharacterized protein YciW
VLDEGGAFALLRDLLVRLRRPDGPFDATMLLVADWDDETQTLNDVEDPADQLAAPRFFANLLDAVMESTPKPPAALAKRVSAAVTRAEQHEREALRLREEAQEELERELRLDRPEARKLLAAFKPPR